MRYNAGLDELWAGTEDGEYFFSHDWNNLFSYLGNVRRSFATIW